MFVALEVRPQPRRFFLWRWLFGSEDLFYETGRAAGASYTRIVSACSEIPWSRVEQAAGREVWRLLLPEGVAPPPGSRVRQYEPASFSFRLLLNAMLRVLEGQRNLCIAVYDEQAVFPECLPELGLFAKDLRVVTRRPAAYRVQADRLALEWGLSVLITESVRAAEQADVVFAPCGFEKLCRPDTLVFAPRGKTRGGTAVSAGAFLPPERVAGEIPEQYDPTRFCAALYEQCHAFLPMEIRSDGVIVQGSPLGFHQCAQILIGY